MLEINSRLLLSTMKINNKSLQQALFLIIAILKIVLIKKIYLEQSIHKI